jgi:hypothetical protein
MQRITVTEIYLPVRHSNGEDLVQITTPDGHFCGWADGRGKYDIAGTWEVSTQWNATQERDFQESLAILADVADVRIAQDGLARQVTTTLST